MIGPNPSHLGRAWPSPSRFNQAMAQVPYGNFIINDDGARGHRDSKVGLSGFSLRFAQSYYSANSSSYAFSSYQHHSIDEPAFLLGMGFSS
jgi:hypothetical protein